MSTERLLALGVGTTEYTPNSRANVIFFFNLGAGTVYARPGSGVDNNNYEGYANTKRWGWVARPHPIERMSFYVAAACNVTIIEDFAADPLAVMGKQGQEQIVSIGSALPAGTNNIGKVDVNSLPATAAADGTDGTGIIAPTGAVGIRGWLSGIYNALVTAGIKIVAALPAGTNIIGLLGIDQTTPGVTNGVQVLTGPGAWAVPGTSTANAAQTLAKAGVGGKSHYITAMVFSVSTAATGAAEVPIQLKDGSTVVYDDILPSTWGVGNHLALYFATPIKLTAGNAANLVVNAMGAGSISKANLIGYTL